MSRTPRFSIVLAAILAAAPWPIRAQEFVPVTDETLESPGAEDWLRWRRDSAASGYSPLQQIQPGNAGRLRLEWARAMQPGRQQQEPLVYRGVMYLPHATGAIQALDARSGELIWEFVRQIPAELRDNTTRNITLYGDRIFASTQDGFLIALDAATGRQAWEVRTGDPGQRISYSTGPVAGDGKILAGATCGVSTPSACFLTAHDPATGRELWRRHSVAGPGDPAGHNATWGGVPYEGRKKASFWMSGSYDPGLKLVYWTTASASPYPELHKGTGSGSLLYTNSILALDAATGAIRWFFQMQPRDNFDMDHQDNPILADVEIRGSRRQAVFALGKPGILWAFDRRNGEHLWHRQLVTYQNLYRSIDPATGAITMNEDIIPREIGATQLVCPGMRGGKLFQTNAYNPRTNMLYNPVSNECTLFKVVSLEETASGARYSQLEHMEGSEGKVGRVAAVSASSGEILWTYDQRAAVGSILTTGGGLLFFGDLHRYFRALDAATGRKLWEIPLSGPVMGYPISYGVEGKQYVAVAVGGNSSGQLHLSQLYPELKTQRGANLLMVFGLAD